MELENRDRLRRHYGSPDTADAYHAKHRRSAIRRLANWREQVLLRRMLSRLAPVESVLDCPCGAGRFLPGLLGQTRRLLAFDQSEAMVRWAQSSVSMAAVADAARMPLRGGSVDVVVCMRLVHHCVDAEERVGILREAARVARRGVILSFADADTWRGSRARSRRRPVSRQSLREQAERAGLRLDPPIVPIGSMFSALSFALLRIDG